MARKKYCLPSVVSSIVKSRSQNTHTDKCGINQHPESVLAKGKLTGAEKRAYEADF